MLTKQEMKLQCLRKILRPGSEVYVICTHVARSGMMRHIAVLVPVKGEIRNISCQVADVLGWGTPKNDAAVKVSGCGMDMGFHLVYSLGNVLFPRGGVRNGQHESGGYLLTCRWL